jgi:ferredoxin-thioredoxin reductase catalytic subunit
MSDLKAKITESVEKYANKAGYRLNPDPEALDGIIDGLVENVEKHGKRYCPCRIITGDKTIDSEGICPCKAHKEEIEKDGSCHCELYLKKN